MSRGPIWIDADVLINIEKGTDMAAEAALIGLRGDGYELLLTPWGEHEFLYGGKSTFQDAGKVQKVLDRVGVKVDRTVPSVKVEQVRAWREQAMHNISGEDATSIAQIRASAATRKIENPIYLTKDGGGTVTAMRRNGVSAIEFNASTVRNQVAAEAAAPPPIPPTKTPGGGGGKGGSSGGKGGGGGGGAGGGAGGAGAAALEGESAASRIWTAAKAGFKAGLKDAFKAENIAAMIPDVILMVADKVAARDAVRNIKRKFLKEGFAKGVAAAVMEWSEQEVVDNAMNSVTYFRVQGMEDPGGLLSLTYILKLAESTENYAVALGYVFARHKTLEWRQATLKDAIEKMRGYGFVFETTRPDGSKAYSRQPTDDTFFEFDFIKKLSWMISPKTDPMVENAIR